MSNFNIMGSSSFIEQKEPIEFGCFACNTILVEPLKLPFCDPEGKCWFCISCLTMMFKTCPLRMDCPKCHQRFTTPESPEI